MDHLVSSTSLNLRSEPRVTASNRLAVLPHGQAVKKLADASQAGWWKVSTILNGLEMTGFAASEFLEPETTPSQPAAATGITAVHLQENRPEVTHTSLSRAFPIGVAGRPTRNSDTASARIYELREIIDFLDVRNSARYKAGSGNTFCNIYTYDYCYLSRVYLPRVWWTARALVDLSAGRPVAVKYGETVDEINANSLNNWFRDFGSLFGWSRVLDTEALQEAANQGGIAVISAQRTELNRSGHICLVAPENPPLVALRKAGVVDLPLQSQAGAKNFSYSTGTTKWWAGSQFRTFSFWVHD
jgi:hypothetical protein